MSVVSPREPANVSYDRRARGSESFLIPFMALIGSSTMFVAPVYVVGVVERYSLTQGQVGGILTFELLCSAITALGLSSVLSRLNVRRVILFSAIALIIGQIASGITIPLTAFIALRLIVGLACGAIYALSLSLAARHSNGIRLMSFSLIFSNLVFGLGLALWPALIQQYGLLPLFSALGVMTIPLAIQALVGGDVEPAEPIGTEEEPAARMPRTPVLLLAAVCVFGNGGFAMLWAFAQVSGEVRGFPVGQIGLVLAGATLASIVGSSISAYIGWRKGVVLPLVIGLAIGIFAGSLVATSSGIAQYALGILIYGFATFFVVPYMISIGGMIENTGRAAMISGAAIYLSGALAPIVGGVIAEAVSMPALEWTSSFLVLMAVTCAWVLHRTIRA